MPRIHRTLAALVALTRALATSTAQAAPPDVIEHARQLFVEAESDEDAERWSDALEKLGAVAQVKLTAGVRYHVALCEEHLGQLARALSDYTAAAEQARSENAKDVLRTVGKQLDALEPRVPRLTIHVEPAVPGTSVTIDGESAPDTASGSAIRIDPGAHRVEATAPDRPRWSEVVTVQERESRVVDIQLGEPAPAVAPSAIAAVTSAPAAPSRGLPIAATAVAVALAGGGLAAFLLSGSEHDRAVRDCAPTTVSCQESKDRVRAWDFAAAGMWSGAVVAGVIAVALWTRSSDAPNKGGARLMVGPGELGVEGRF
jgi:hypothetical protein